MSFYKTAALLPDIATRPGLPPPFKKYTYGMSDTVVSPPLPEDEICDQSLHIIYYSNHLILRGFGGSKRNVISLEYCVHYSTWQSPHSSSDSVFLYFQTQWKLPIKHMELRYTHTPLQNISTSHISKRRSLHKAPGARNHLYISKWSSVFQSQKPGWRLVYFFYFFSD